MVMLAARFFEPSALMALPPETGRERMDSPCRSAVPSTSTPFPTSLVQHARYTLSSAKVGGPIVHEPSAPLEQVRPRVGRLGLVADHVRQRRLDHLLRVVGLLGCPIAE